MADNLKNEKFFYQIDRKVIIIMIMRREIVRNGKTYNYFLMNENYIVRFI